MAGLPTLSLTAPSPACDHRVARGFTLVELLVASTIGLIVMGSLATLLGLFSRTASSTQSVIDMTHRLRVVGDRLRKDLAGVTCKLEPPVSPDSDSGYFEIIEGPATDTASWNSLTNKWIPLVDTNNNDWKGDPDDLLLFTTRNSGEPFVGKYGSTTIQASTAEVTWFVWNGNLHRRQLLVVPYVGRDPFLSGTNAAPSASFKFDVTSMDYDLSLRQKNNFVYPNSLGDLSKPENRFRHVLDGATGMHLFFPLSKGPIVDGTSTNSQIATFNGYARAGEDVILRNVLSFDVRVFDADAVINRHPDISLPLGPGDRGYTDTKAVQTAARGAYVDLGWGAGTYGVPESSFDINPQSLPGFDNRFPGSEDKNKNGSLDIGEDSLANTAIDIFTPFQGWGLWPINRLNPYATRDLDEYPLTYDTWSTHYESNGINEDGDLDTDGVTPLIDEGTDGRDNNGDGIPDDPAERETSPPYPVPLRGIEVRIRCIEPTTKEIRQITIRHAFQ
jgi:prepilin-type N-terminal cleavage/methylation domain-containing protein